MFSKKECFDYAHFVSMGQIINLLMKKGKLFTSKIIMFVIFKEEVYSTDNTKWCHCPLLFNYYKLTFNFVSFKLLYMINN